MPMRRFPTILWLPIASAVLLILGGCATNLWPFGGPSVQTFVTGGQGFADGSAQEARFLGPGPLALDTAGNLYVLDTGNVAVRKITPAGQVTTLAGDGQGYADGPGANARFMSPLGIAVAPTGVVYVADSGNNRIRAIAPDGTVSTLTGSTAGNADGPASTARFRAPGAVAVDKDGRLYIADTNNGLIKVLETNGQVKTLAGDASKDQPGDGQGTDASFGHLEDLEVGPDGTLWILDAGKLRRMDAAGNVRTVATLSVSLQIYGSNGMSGSSYATANAITCDQDGTVYACFSDRLKKVDREGNVSFVAGYSDTVATSFEANKGDAEGPGGSARFRAAWGLALDPHGTLYISDREANRIRKLSIR